MDELKPGSTLEQYHAWKAEKDNKRAVRRAEWEAAHPGWSKHRKKGGLRFVDKTLPENQGRYAVMYNQITHKSFIVDSYKARYDRMRKHVVTWAELMNHLDGEKFYKMLSLTYDTLGTKIDPTHWTPKDITRFERSLFAYMAHKFPGITLLGYAWVGEIQPVSKQYHYHLVLVTTKRLHFPNDKVTEIWGLGFTKVTVANSPFYLVSYVKKKDQKNYFYFPRGARGYHCWVNPSASVHGQNCKRLLRWSHLKLWQHKYLADVAEDDQKNLDFLKDVGPPVSGWVFAGAYNHLEYAEQKIVELIAEQKSLENSEP